MLCPVQQLVIKLSLTLTMCGLPILRDFLSKLFENYMLIETHSLPGQLKKHFLQDYYYIYCGFSTDHLTCLYMSEDSCCQPPALLTFLCFFVFQGFIVMRIWRPLMCFPSSRRRSPFSQVRHKQLHHISVIWISPALYEPFFPFNHIRVFPLWQIPFFVLRIHLYYM